MENIITDIEKEKLLDSRKMLNQWTSGLFNKQNKHKFQSEIDSTFNDNIDETLDIIHLKAHGKFKNLDMKDICFMKDLFDFIKVEIKK